MIMVFNATFNNITIISWQSLLLVEETGAPGENHRPAANHWQTSSHNVVSSTLVYAERHTIQWPQEKGQKDTQWSTKHSIEN
jgi:hypothetical protein